MSVRITNSYHEEWGSKRMSACYWHLNFQFSGELMSQHCDSRAYIGSISITSPADCYYSSRVIADIPSTAAWHEQSLSAPHWRFRLPCSSPSYRVRGDIVDVNGKKHAWSYLIPGDNSAHDPNHGYYSEGMQGGHGLQGEQFFFFTVDPQPQLFPNGESRVCYWNNSVKLMTLSNRPTKVVYALHGGVATPATCVERLVNGEFDIKWDNDSTSTSAFYSDTLAGELVQVSILPAQYHVLDFLKWLPRNKIKHIMAAITKDIYIETTRVCYSRVITFENDKTADTLLREIGVELEEERERLIRILTSIITKHNSIADWKRANPNPMQKEKFIQVCFDKTYDLPIAGEKLTNEIIEVLQSWESTSVKNYESVLATEEKMKNEKHYYYNGDRIMWLLIQRNHADFSRLPIECVRRIAFMLPPTKYGVLKFGYQYNVYYRCAGTDYFGETISLDPVKKIATFWQRSNESITGNVFTCQFLGSQVLCYYNGNLTKTLNVLPDVEFGGVFLSTPTHNYYQLSLEESKRLETKREETFRGGPVNRSRSRF